MCPVDINVSWVCSLTISGKGRCPQLHRATPLLLQSKLLNGCGRISTQQFLLLLPASLPPSWHSPVLRGECQHFPVFPPSELATKLNGNLTFSITICLVGHLVPPLSAQQVLTPAKTPWVPPCPLLGQPVETEAQSDHSRYCRCSSASVSHEVSEQHSPVEGGAPLLTTRSPFLQKEV